MFNLMPFDFGRTNMWRRMQREFDAMNRMFESFEPVNMRCDVEDLGDHYEISMELPGMSKDEISLQVSDNVLTISAERQTDVDRSPEIRAEKAEDDGKDDTALEERQAAELDRPGRYIHRERSYQRTERHFNVEDVIVSEITASYENGILTVKLPKKHPTEAEDDVFTVEID